MGCSKTDRICFTLLLRGITLRYLRCLSDYACRIPGQSVLSVGAETVRWPRSTDLLVVTWKPCLTVL